MGSYGSILWDVHIVNENDIWVVGNIEIPDSSHLPSYGHCNAAHWDGSNWEFIRINNSSVDLHQIQYFSEEDIWVTSHCFPYHWDGIEWTLYHLENMGMDTICVGSAIWGTSSSNMYFVGLNGGIVHYNGVEFVEMDGMTEINLTSISGYPNSLWLSGETHAGEIDHGSVLLFYDGFQ